MLQQRGRQRAVGSDYSSNGEWFNTTTGYVTDKLICPNHQAWVFPRTFIWLLAHDNSGICWLWDSKACALQSLREHKQLKVGPDSQFSTFHLINDHKAEESKGWFLSAHGCHEGLMWYWIRLNAHRLLKLLVFLPSQICGSHWMWWKCGLTAKTAVWSLWLAGFILRIKGDLHQASFFYSEPQFPKYRKENSQQLEVVAKIWASCSDTPGFESASAPSSYMTFGKLLNSLRLGFSIYNIGIIRNTCLCNYFIHSTDIYYWVSPTYEAVP